MSSNGPPGGWAAFSREFLADLVTLAQAELGEAKRELKSSWRRIGLVAGLGAAALFLLIWLPALVGYVLVRVVALWLPDWGAGLVVFGIFLLLAAGLGGAAYLLAKRLKNPMDVMLRRLQEHLEWWRREVQLRPTDAIPPAGGGAERPEETR